MAKSKFWEDFKTFAMRGNAIDMAVGIIVGGAFGKIVSSLVNDLIMPPIGLLIGGVNFTQLHLTLKHAVTDPVTGEVVSPAVTVNYGNFMQTTIDFLIIAFAIFLLTRIVVRFHQKREAAAPAPAPSPEVTLLEQIRDLLKEKKDGNGNA